MNFVTSSTDAVGNSTDAVGNSTDGPTGAPDTARLLHPAARPVEPLDEAILRDIAAGLGSVADDVEMARPGLVERTRLLATEAYDAWLLVWGPGAVVESHDHDGSIGVLQVVDGHLLEIAADLEGRSRCGLRLLAPGDSSSFGVTDLHGLRNPTTTGAVAVAVYSPPLGHPVEVDARQVCAGSPG